MGFVIVLVVILLFAGFIFISIKLNNLRDRATQHILKNTGFSSSEMENKIVGGLGKKQLEKFIEEHPNFTEETLKDELKEYTEKLINKNSSDDFSQAVLEKMQKDSKLEKLQTMQFSRTNISYYNGTKLGAIVTYSDNKNEYNIDLTCSVLNEKIQVEKYQVSKGAVLGF